MPMEPSVAQAVQPAEPAAMPSKAAPAEAVTAAPVAYTMPGAASEVQHSQQPRVQYITQQPGVQCVPQQPPSVPHVKQPAKPVTNSMPMEPSVAQTVQPAEPAAMPSKAAPAEAVTAAPVAYTMLGAASEV